MNKLRWILLLLLLLVTASTVSAQNRDQLPAGQWNQIVPGGDTVCGHGAPYSFYYRENPGQDLLIYFQGGGMCWNGQTCSPTGDKTFDESINPGDPSDNPGIGAVGIFDLGNPDNPFLNYDILFVNYCSGDMHTGNKVTGLTYNDVYFEIKNRGAINAAYALNWAYNNIPVPDSVFVTGCSAGAVGAAYWGADIKAHYPNQRVTVLGDSGGGWRGIDGATWNLWGTNYQGATGANVNNAQFYVGASRQGARIAQYNTASDESQAFFHFVGFSGVAYPDALRANLRDISRAVGSFRSYTMYGDLHCIMPRQEFYSYTMGSARLRDWVANLAAGNPVSNVQ
jgi:hypothetical protein